MIDAQNSKVYDMALRRAAHLTNAYPNRFSYHPDDHYILYRGKAPERDSEMPAIPKPMTKLPNGQYTFMVTQCKTTQGSYGPQEELLLEVVDRDLQPTGQKMLTWIGHNAVRAYKMAHDAGLLDVDEAKDEWSVIVPVYFIGVISDGKIIAMVKR